MKFHNSGNAFYLFSVNQKSWPKPVKDPEVYNDPVVDYTQIKITSAWLEVCARALENIL
jgi:hypothetical protein